MNFFCKFFFCIIIVVIFCLSVRPHFFFQICGMKVLFLNASNGMKVLFLNASNGLCNGGVGGSHWFVEIY